MRKNRSKINLAGGWAASILAYAVLDLLAKKPGAEKINGPDDLWFVDLARQLGPLGVTGLNAPIPDKEFALVGEALDRAEEHGITFIASMPMRGDDIFDSGKPKDHDQAVEFVCSEFLLAEHHGIYWGAGPSEADGTGWQCRNNADTRYAPLSDPELSDRNEAISVVLADSLNEFPEHVLVAEALGNAEYRDRTTWGSMLPLCQTIKPKLKGNQHRIFGLTDIAHGLGSKYNELKPYEGEPKESFHALESEGFIVLDHWGGPFDRQLVTGHPHEKECRAYAADSVNTLREKNKPLIRVVEVLDPRHPALADCLGAPSKFENPDTDLPAALIAEVKLQAALMGIQAAAS